MPEQALRFILEQPSDENNKGAHRKRARLVTACDSCRSKKIKCTPSEIAGGSGACESCVQNGSRCDFSDRDRYHAERGVSLSEHISARPPQQSSSSSSSIPEPGKQRKRRRTLDLPPSDRTSPSVSHQSATDYRALPFSQHPNSTGTIYNDKSLEAGSVFASAPPAGSLKRVIVPFFRWFGATSNTPGYRRVRVRTLTLSEDQERDQPTYNRAHTRRGTHEGVSGPSLSKSADPFDSLLRVQVDSDPSRFAMQPGMLPAQGEDPRPLPPTDTAHLFDPVRPRYPSPLYLPHLSRLFFEKMACHFPFLDERIVTLQAEEGSLSAILANCLAGIAVRFSEHEELFGGSRSAGGEPFVDMAKLLIVHMLSWPSLEVLQALVLIAWAEFGSGRDSGLWMYSRMAISMAMDLGLNYEATIQLTSVPEERERVRLTWWAVILIDRINSWGTGRPIAIADDQFDTHLPSCDPAAGDDYSRPPPASFVYGHLCRLVQLRGKMGDVLNGIVKRKEQQYPVGMELSELQSHMTFFYQSLPPSLLFTMQNFRRFSNHEQAATFLLLHVMFHSVITLLHRPSLLRNFTPDVALPLSSNVDLSRSSARSIVDMVLLANEVDPIALVTNPFLDLPILTAARGFLAERDVLSKPGPLPNSSLTLLQLQWSENSLKQCKDILSKISIYWGGVGTVKTILDQQSSGRLDFDIGEGAQPDSRIHHLRDVELMKQWATTAWRRQRPSLPPTSTSPRKGRSRVSSPRPVVPLLPVSHSTFQYGSTTGADEALSTDSPQDAALGITGYLEALGPSSSLGPDWAIDPPLSSDSFRVLFNTAEADLSFRNSMSNELFSISEGFDEFLASHNAPFMQSTGLSSNEQTSVGAGHSGGFLVPGHGGQSSEGVGPSGAGTLAGVNEFPHFYSLGLPFSTLTSRSSSPMHR